MMMAAAADLAVIATASTLIVAGSAKIVSPDAIAVTLQMLLRVNAGLGPSSWRRVGRLIGIVEVGLATAIVVVRAPVTAAALAAFSVGLAAAGAAGISGGTSIPCACFGKSSRTLGWPHVAQLPLWLAAAWCVSRPPLLFGMGTRTEQALAALAVCVCASTVLQVGRLAAAVGPLTRRRLRSVRDLSRAPSPRWTA